MKRVLVANRGEIAVRIIRACHDEGFEAVAVYSDVDEDALHVKLADQAYHLGPAPATESYLNQDALIQAAKRTCADAVHPGYGFLAENPDFAQRVLDAGLIWVGPSPDVIRNMGDKSAARSIAVAAGVPVVPGTDLIPDKETAHRNAEILGYPVLLKAAEGGGGKGIRVVESARELDEAYEVVMREVQASFGSANLYFEKLLQDVRHIEVQVLGDEQGNYVHLFERDCSIQRRRQKVLEEAPASGLSEVTRQSLYEHAINLAREMKYTSAGTVEFLVDKLGNVYFIEVNTRIQVEHGISEMVTGIDICAEQLRIAAGEKLSVSQPDISCVGFSLEARINAENPAFHFIGSPGLIEQCHLPGGMGVRVDTFIGSGVVIQPHYDSLIAKVMVHAHSREAAIRKLQRALDELQISGIITTTDLIKRILSQGWFKNVDYTTDTLEVELPHLLQNG